jgi:metal-dependent amidase/aminoacylase/carboxypeptidase family protein
MRKVLKSEKIFSRMVELRRAIHSYPELAFKEEKTARLIMNELDRLRISYEY